MEGWLRSECTCNRSTALSSSSCKPQNKYLIYLLDEFEKCSQQSNDLSKLQKVGMVSEWEVTTTFFTFCYKFLVVKARIICMFFKYMFLVKSNSIKLHKTYHLKD